MKYISTFCLFLVVVCALGQRVYSSNTLEINEISPGIFVHVTFLATEDYGNVACNGMVVINEGEALVFDTPTDDSVSMELINWVKTEQNAVVKGVVINHFHADCLGGLEAFHKEGIDSYANQTTINLALKNKLTAPLISFEQSLKLKAGKLVVENRFFGEAHSPDNIISYVRKQNIMFGGCMVKALKAKQGYLGDANVEQWSQTVKNIKSAYQKVEKVIPGHGAVGGIELLDYTISLFGY